MKANALVGTTLASIAMAFTLTPIGASATTGPAFTYRDCTFSAQSEAASTPGSAVENFTYGIAVTCAQSVVTATMTATLEVAAAPLGSYSAVDSVTQTLAGSSVQVATVYNAPCTTGTAVKAYADATVTVTFSDGTVGFHWTGTESAAICSVG